MVLEYEYFVVGWGDFVQEVGYYGVLQFDGLCLGFCCIDGGFGEFDFCYDDFLEILVFKSYMGVM